MQVFIAPLMATLLIATALLPAGESVNPDLEAKFQELLVRLDDDDWRVRREATEAVMELPAEALPLVEAVLRDQNLSPEVQIHLSSAIENLQGKAEATVHLRQRQAKFERYRDFLLAEYDRAGRKDAPWDATAREALVMYAAAETSPEISPQAKHRVEQALGECIESGCDDPLVRLCLVERRTAGTDEFLDLFDEADALTEVMLAQDYTPRLKIQSLMTRARMRAVRWRIEPPGVHQNHYLQDLDAALALFPEMRRHGQPLDDSNLSLAVKLFTLYHRAGLSDAKRDAIAAALDQALPEGIDSLLFSAQANMILAESAGLNTPAGQNYVDRAWMAASEGARRAPNSLTAAQLKLRCVNPSVETEKFQRLYEVALFLDRHDFQTHAMMLNSLIARRDDAAIRTYADYCLDTEAWGARIPALGAVAYRYLAVGMSYERRREYLASPEVWSRIERGYVGVLRVYPGDATLRSEYLRFSCEAELWEIADQQFRILGDNIEAEQLGGDAQAQYLRDKASRLAGADRQGD